MAKSFLKKKEVQEEGDVAARQEEATKSLPVYDEKNKVVFVNGAKFRRAERILDLIRNKVAPQKAEEVERKDHYTRQLAKHEVDAMSDDALPALYELMGGLIRTPQEQREAEKKAEEAKKKGKKRMIE